MQKIIFNTNRIKRKFEISNSEKEKSRNVQLRLFITKKNLHYFTSSNCASSTLSLAAPALAPAPASAPGCAPCAS